MTNLSILKTKPKEFKLLAWLIMKIEGTSFSHVAISYVDESMDIRYVAEARGGGIRILSNTQFKQDNFIVSGSHYECDLDRIKAAHKYIYNQLAKNYDKKMLLGLGVMRLKILLCKILKCEKAPSNPFKNGDYSQVCCELGLNVIKLVKDVVLPIDIEDCGLKEFNRIDLKHGTPIPQEKIDKINGVKL
jgi:hypothetical protein